MASGLWRGASGLALGTALFVGTGGLWNGEPGLVDGYFTPAALFSAGEQGVWLDPNDFSTMFQDSAGTTPVTAVGQVVGRINDKSGRGNHATQATAASKPILAKVPYGGRRNLLTYTEQFDNGAWSSSGVTVTANGAFAPNNELTADQLTATVGNSYCRATYSVVAGTTYTFSVYVKTATTACSLSLRLYQDGGVTEIGATPFTTTASWQRITVTGTSAVTGTAWVLLGGNATFSSSETLYVWGAQLELGSTATAYQKVVSTHEVTEAGKSDCHYLSFDGVDDFLSTASIDFTATDKMSVFAGVRKLSDAATGIFVEHGQAGVDARAMTISVPRGNTATGSSIQIRDGTNFPGTRGPNAAQPYSSVISLFGDYTAGTIATQTIVRTNGSVAGNTIEGAGIATGVFGNYPLYIGRRAGGTLPFTGHLYGLVIAGRTATASEITNTETYLNRRVGAY